MLIISSNQTYDRNSIRSYLMPNTTWLSNLSRRQLRDILLNMQARRNFLPNDNVFHRNRERTLGERGGERLSSLSHGDRPSGIAKIPRARFVILYTTGALVSKEWRTRKALSEIQTLHLPIYLLHTRAHIIRLFA